MGAVAYNAWDGFDKVLCWMTGVLSILKDRYGINPMQIVAGLAITGGALLSQDSGLRSCTGAWLQHQSWQQALLLGGFLCLMAAIVGQLLAKRSPGVYLWDFCVFPIPKQLRLSREDFLTSLQDGTDFTPESIANHRNILFGSELGLGDAAGLSDGLMHHRPMDTSLEAGLQELEMATFGAVQGALDATGLKANEVDFVLSATNMIVPLPSVGAMVSHRFGMRDDLTAYHLGGQGCAAGVLILQLAQTLLKAHPGKTALVVLHENTTRGFSRSANKGAQISNCLFRLNGAALIMSSRPQDRRRAKYELLHTEKTLLTTDEAFNSIKVREDENGIQAVFLQKRQLIAAAGTCIRSTLRRLAPRILPLPELVRVLLVKGHKPDLATAMDHILIHTGAAAVIASVADALRLGPEAAAPSKETLHHFGNTSVCSTYYILANIESRVGVKKGERILQLGFGSGFKCAAAYWRALRDVRCTHPAWEPYGA